MQHPKKTSVCIGLAGDTMIGRLVNSYLEKTPPASIWGDLLPLLKSSDLNLINLEAALTHSTNIVHKAFNFKSDPKNVQSLLEGAIDVVNLANNHVLDFSEEGLLETLETLDQANIKHVGAGRNIQEASAPIIITRHGIRIGILGCTDNEPSWIATGNRPGIRYLDVGDLGSIQANITALRPQVDLLILSIHWGPNMRERPSSQFVAFAHELIDLGVDLIHGHSAHIFQGIEVYKKKLILYDTGDFVDDYYVDPRLRNDRSFFFIIEANKQGLRSLRLVPTLISSFQVNKAIGQEAEQTLQRMQELSQEFHTSLLRQDHELLLTF